MTNETYLDSYPEDIRSNLGVIPKVTIYPSTTVKRTRSGYGDTVAIIGAFPKISKSIERYTNLRTARAGLGIQKGKHDAEYVLNEKTGAYEENPDYFAGAGALKRIFMEDADYDAAREVIICNITTCGSCDSVTGQTTEYNTTLTFNDTLATQEAGTNLTDYYLYVTSPISEDTDDGTYLYEEISTTGTSTKKYQVFKKTSLTAEYKETSSSKAVKVTLYIPVLDSTKLSNADKVTMESYLAIEDGKYQVDGVVNGGTSGTSFEKNSSALTHSDTTFYKAKIQDNPTYWDTDADGVIDFDEEIHDKIPVALERLKNDDFDILFVADYLNKTDFEKIRKFMYEIYKVRNPNGLVAPVYAPKTTTTTTTTDNACSNPSLIETYEEAVSSKTIDVDKVIEYLELFKDDQWIHSLFALVPDRYYLSTEASGNALSNIESAAYYCGFLAGLKVNKAPAQRAIPKVSGLYEELIFAKTTSQDTPSDGYRLVEAGASVSRCLNRSDNEYGVVNSTLPSGFDTAHMRTTAYIVRQLKLEPYLKRVSNDTTLTYIQSAVDEVRELCVDAFDNVYSIDTSVTQITNTCVEIQLNIVYYGYIVDEVVFVTEEIYDDYEVE